MRNQEENTIFYINRTNMIYLAISIFVLLISCIIVILLFAVNPVKEAVLDIVALNLENTLILLVFISVVVLIFPFTNFVGFLIITRDKSNSAVNKYAQFKITRIIFKSLDIFLIIATIMLFLTTGGPFFLMPFALFPMIIIGFIVAMMRLPLNKATYDIEHMQNIQHDSKKHKKPTFKNGTLKMSILLVVVGFTGMLIYMLFTGLLKIDINSYDIIGVILYTFCTPVFAVYIIMLPLIIFTLLLSKKKVIQTSYIQSDS